MGRKIPGKKHRGIKDPDKQRAQRLAKLTVKRNEPPKDDDEQIIPKSLQRLMKLKNDGNHKNREMKKKKRMRKIKNDLIKIGGRGEYSISAHSKRKAEKNIPVFNQRPNESGSVFWNRVNRETQNFLNEIAFEKKYDVSIKRNPETGEVEGIEKISKDEIDELIKLNVDKPKNTNRDKKNKKKEKVLVEPKLSKIRKRKKKLEMKKARELQEKIDDFKEFRDDIQFGEIIHAPPELKIPRLVKFDSKGTEGANKKLLLHSLLNGGLKDSKV